ncbi:MAG: tetratricopeptide repeat protein [Burkholderiales bacterium]
MIAFPPRFLVLGVLRAFALAAAASLLAACAGQPAHTSAAAPDQEAAATQPAVESATPEEAREPELPKQDLTGETMYEFLLAEIAGQRGNTTLAAQAYADLARKTRDPRVAERATQVAVEARMPEAAIESAKIWADTAPESTRALGAAASLLVNAKRLDEAQPYLERILALSGDNRGDGFMQLNRLLSGNPDKAASLRAIQSLAGPYPALPQARFAVAAAASNAGQDELALKEVRAASQLKPDWELAALFEAQLLQKTSNAAASERLAQYLKTYPMSREVRLAYARTLVADKRYPEARVEFDRLAKDYPDNIDVVYSIALLSMQLEDWPVAEANLKRLLDLGYRDRNAVRFYLGQVAEERKNFPEALKWYGEVTPGQQYMPAQIRSAQVISKQGDLAGARKYLQQVNAQSSEQRVQLILAEAQLLRDAKQEREAFGLVDQALDKLPNNPELLYDHAMLAERIDRVDVLESSLRKLIRIKPDNAHAYNALGYTLADRNQRLVEANELIDTALKLAPDDAFIMDSKGWVLYRQGRTEEGLAYLQRAYSIRPDAEIAAHLGEVLWVLGRHADARKVWDEALKKSPENETLTKTVQRLGK